MLEELVRFSIRRRGLVLVLVLAALGSIAAGVATTKLSIDAVPDVTNVQVSIITLAPSLSPVEVEQYLTYPIETAMLFVTLGTLRGSIAAALAIPLSMGVAVAGMVWLKVTGNPMSLGAIDFGLLVDGAIVMLEATMVALLAAQHRPGEPVDIPEVVAQAMSRSARAVTFSVGIIPLPVFPLGRTALLRRLCV